jgi:hypothetical protein
MSVLRRVRGAPGRADRVRGVSPSALAITRSGSARPWSGWRSGQARDLSGSGRARSTNVLVAVSFEVGSKLGRIGESAHL